MHILSLGILASSTCERLSARHRLTVQLTPPANLAIKDVHRIEVVVLRSPFYLDRALLDKLPMLSLVVRAGSGQDSVALDELERRSIKFRASPVASSSVAELAFGLLLGSMRQIPFLHTSLREGRWLKWEARGSQIEGKTIVILGFGQVGRRIARIAFAFGANVLLIDRSPGKPEKREAAKCVGARFCSVSDALPEADVLIICCPLTDETRNLIGMSELHRMKAGSFLINVSRGGIVDYSALEWAIESGRLKGAGIDVFPVEPPNNMPLLSHPYVVASPHIGAQTGEAMELVGQAVEGIIAEYERDRRE